VLVTWDSAYVSGVVNMRTVCLCLTGVEWYHRTFVIFHRQVDRLFLCRYLRSLNGSPDIIHVAAALLSIGARLRQDNLCSSRSDQQTAHVPVLLDAF